MITGDSSKVAQIFLVVIFSFGWSSCTNDSEAQPPTPISVCGRPLVVGLINDKSGSMTWSGTPTLSVEDLKPLIHRIVDCGGELGVNFVKADSGKLLERFYVHSPGDLPSQPIQKPNEEDYEFADRMDAYYEEINKRNDSILKHRSDVQHTAELYLTKLEPLLSSKPSGSTDLWTSLRVQDVFLCEKGAWTKEPRKFLIVITDGDDTVGKAKAILKTDAKVIWVNGRASEKNLDKLASVRVESFQSAVREILVEGVE